MKTHTLDLTVVIPFYNEEGSVAGLVAELRQAIEIIGVSAEAICVDDGSTDGTLAALREAELGWPAMRVLPSERNQGQAEALRRGIKASRGKRIATLDGDGQNPPSELYKLWALREEADMIAGVRADRQDTLLRKAMSRFANATRRAILRDGATDTGCSLKLFRREVAETFLPIRTMYSFLAAFAISGGFTVREVPVLHRRRETGTSKYGLRAMALRPFMDMAVVALETRRRRRT